MEEQQKTAQYIKMVETPVPKLIITLGIPTIISMLVTNIYNMADTFYVGKLGTSASGAVGIVFGLMAVLQAFGFMFGHGAGSIISRKLGQQDTKSASRFASTSFFLSLTVGLLIEVMGLLFLEPFMLLLGSTETILPYAKQYGMFILLAAPFLTSSCVLNNILRYEGRAAYAMVGLTLGAILNIVLDPIFMFVLHMGALGAGLSTAVSQLISFIVLLGMFLSGKTESKLSIHLITKDLHEVIMILCVGFPSMVRQGLSSISTMVLNAQAAVYGDAAVAAMSIVNRISMFIFSVGLGMGQGFQPVAAFNYGAGKYERVKKGFWFTACFGEILLGTFAMVGFVLSGTVIGWFRDDPAVIKIGITALRFQCIACFFQPLTVCTNMMFQSVGKSGRASLLSSLRGGVCFLPCILILPHFFGITGVQIAQTIADVVTFLITLPLLLQFLKTLSKDKLHSEV